MADNAYIFLDSNTLLHFQRPDQIDWQRLTGCRTVCLMVAPIVIRELEKLKVESRSQRLRVRAQNVVRWLATLAKTPSAIRPGVSLLFVRHEPLIDFAAERLSERIQDDHLIASALQFAADNKEAVSIYTADLGLQVKLQGRPLGLVVPWEELRLPNEPTNEERELAEAREELQKQRSRMPKLELYFEGRTRDCYLKFDPYSALDAEPEESLMPYTYVTVSGRDSWADYAEEYEDWQKKAVLSGSFTLIIANEGTLAATNVYVRLDFPKGIRPLAYDGEPNAPVSGGFRGPSISNPDDPEYRQQSITYELKELAHNRDSIFEPARVLFRSRTEPTEFSVDYTIKCSELLGAINGSLTFTREINEDD